MYYTYDNTARSSRPENAGGGKGAFTERDMYGFRRARTSGDQSEITACAPSRAAVETIIYFIRSKYILTLL